MASNRGSPKSKIPIRRRHFLECTSRGRYGGLHSGAPFAFQKLIHASFRFFLGDSRLICFAKIGRRRGT
jgi:hypothetical protein